ncbi:hypothetical protein CLIB1444_07S03136 [[Candida] jaroonii]|uniref:Uncharacterized protein n=1 Tax=[Candida] jaroonii TaxID=467808 RepID=A0ACA9YB14_9ASCO|nr:hypothetical protein CLIB1444_07S03136 [[Candida] jaroonii]
MNNRIRSISIASLNHEKQYEDVTDTAPSSTWTLNEHLQNFPPSHSQPNVVLTHGNKLIDLLLQYPELKHDLNLGVILGKISYLAIGQTEYKALFYKILRYSIINEDSLYLLVQHKILIFIIISLSTNNSNIEKLQAVKLINKFLTIKNGSKFLSIGVIKSLIYLVDESNLKNLIIEIILEISILNPELIYHSNGFNLLIDLVIDNITSNSTIQLNSLLIIIKLLEVENFKNFFRNGYNLVNLISIFENDYDDNEKLPLGKFQRLSFLITVLLKNWNGLISTSLNNFKFLKDFINNLKKPNTKLKEFIIDILLDVTLVRSLPWLRSSTIGEFLTKYGAKKFIYDGEFDESNDDDNHLISNYKNHYQGLISLILIKIGIIDLLIYNLNNSSNNELHDKIILLLSNLYKFSKTYLPLEYNIELSNKINLHSLIKITQYNLQDNLRRPVINYQPINVDDNEFKHLINASKVLTIKEFMDWDWTIIDQLFFGPLCFEKRFNEVLEKQPKFFKRLLSFYRPFKFRFCNMKVKPKLCNKIVLIGEQMFEIFLKFENGHKILFKNKILLQMVELLSQIDPLSGIIADNPILCKKNLVETSNFGYIKFIGKLTKPQGMKLLNYWQFFQLINNIIESSQFTEYNNYFIIKLFETIDYNNSKCLNLLSFGLMIGNSSLKSEIIHLLPKLNLNQNFIIKLAMKNIYDKNTLSMIKLIDLNPEYTKEILKFNPPVHLLNKSIYGGHFLSSLLSTSAGFKYLEKFQYIDANFEVWLQNMRNFEILKYYEFKFNEMFYPYFKNLNPIKYNFFLKKLLDTKEGILYFQKFNNETDFIGSMCHEIETYLKLEKLDSNQFRQLKQSLWILGEINSSKYGIQLIDLNFLIFVINQLKSNKNWSIKGMIFYQIGKISNNSEGIEILDELNWIISNSIQKSNFAYPNFEDDNLFNTENSSTISSINMINEEIIEGNPVVSEIYKFSSFLTRIEKKSAKELITLKKEEPELFNFDNFLKVIKIIDQSSYNFSKRNFIFNLFLDNKDILDNLIKKRKF